MKKRLWGALLFAAILLAAFLILRPDGTLLSQVTLSRIHTAAASSRGFLYLHVERAGAQDTFVTVALDLNDDGVFAPYQVQGGMQQEVLVVDAPALLTENETTGFPISIPDMTISERVPITGFAVFSKTPRATTSVVRTQGEYGVSFVIEKIESADFSDFMATGITDGKRRGFAANAEAALGVLPGSVAFAEETAVRPVEYHIKHEGLPDINQNYNECAPTAVANNMRWLGNKYGFASTLPPDDRDLIDEIKADVQWSDGVFDPDFLPGKNEFIARRGLPLEAHVVGGRRDPDIHWKIFQEMKKGQAIEIGVSFFTKNADGSVRPSGGHTVAVSSVFRHEGKSYVGINDSATRSSGAPQSEVYTIEGAILTDYGGDNEFAVIDYAWAQSPIASVTERTYTDPRHDASLRLVRHGEVLTPPGQSVTKAVTRFGFFNLFIDHPGDHVVGESFPVVASVVARNTRQEMPYWEGGVRRVYTHGAGRPWSLRGSFFGSSELAPTAVHDRPVHVQIAQDRYRIEGTFTCTKPGLAHVSYDAFIIWPRAGVEPPTALLPRYEAQLALMQNVSVYSPPFWCKEEATPARPVESRAARAAQCPGVTEDPAGKEVTVLLYGGDCWPLAQFRVAAPDACGNPHYHAETAISLQGVRIADPNPRECGFGAVGAPTHTVKLTERDAARYLGAVLDTP